MRRQQACAAVEDVLEEPADKPFEIRAVFFDECQFPGFLAKSVTPRRSGESLLAVQLAILVARLDELADDDVERIPDRGEDAVLFLIRRRRPAELVVARVPPQDSSSLVVPDEFQCDCGRCRLRHFDEHVPIGVADDQLRAYGTRMECAPGN